MMSWPASAITATAKTQTIVPLHPAATGTGAEVFGKVPSHHASSASPSWRPSGHEKETPDNTRKTVNFTAHDRRANPWLLP
ncbi:MAG: hypothetical protein M0Z50_07480 [Planctomycetia bacterium]|nr:hypothetical protein [Planctomycetia bacterium]